MCAQDGAIFVSFIYCLNGSFEGFAFCVVGFPMFGDGGCVAVFLGS